MKLNQLKRNHLEFMPINFQKNDANSEENVLRADFSSRMKIIMRGFSRVPLKEKLFFTQNLAIMMKAGISLSQALKTLAVQTTNKKFVAIINELSENVERGVSFSESLKPHEKIFGELFIGMVEAGEMSGKLEDVLRLLFIQLKKQNELISKVKGAITYPIVIISAMGGIGIFMIVFVVPKITDMLKSFNAELPLPTKILIYISHTLVQNGFIFIGLLALLIMGMAKFLKTEKGKFYYHSLLLKLPIFSPIVKKINIARFSRTISSLLKTDIAIIKSFQITANVLGNVRYKNALLDMSEKIKKGGQINDVIRLYPKLFPPTVIQMVQVGEQTGELDTILEELAGFYEEEVNQVMNNLPAIIEPVLILILGVGIGAMAVAIIMPMYSLTSSM